jgi:hypothetical protein
MPALRSAAIPGRAICAALLALVLALRLLTPAGFMPVFENGAVTIAVCPDHDAGAPMGPMHHHQGGSKKLQPQCPYAAVSGPGALAPAVGPLFDVLILAAALLLGRTFLFLERSKARERPPTRAPPIPA